ncbi:hypothetical protein SDC9_118411 [bioreactor metagenome]|uniref:Uncharacterized protein n=1 Tax=bioreactor metagenome TaxID=1076179 RepID=A0A645C0V9_9ZZZZ
MPERVERVIGRNPEFACDPSHRDRNAKNNKLEGTKRAVKCLRQHGPFAEELLPDLAKELLQSAKGADLSAKRAAHHEREQHRRAEENEGSDHDSLEERAGGDQREQRLQSAVRAERMDRGADVAEGMQRGCREHKGEKAAERDPAEDTGEERKVFFAFRGRG